MSYTSIYDHTPATKPLPQVQEITPQTLALWLQLDTVTETDRGEENIYVVDQFGHPMYCKCL